MYASGLTKENYLRGVQEADASGVVTFTTIFPGCYAGRMPHVHFEVYPTLAKAASAAGRIKTSQFTFPMATLNEVYATTGYAPASRNLASISYATDNVFSDGTSAANGGSERQCEQGYVGDADSRRFPLTSSSTCARSTCTHMTRPIRSRRAGRTWSTN
jgi:hypothetical protein